MEQKIKLEYNYNVSDASVLQMIEWSDLGIKYLGGAE